jgi:hypothetical protein
MGGCQSTTNKQHKQIITKKNRKITRNESLNKSTIGNKIYEKNKKGKEEKIGS